MTAPHAPARTFRARSPRAVAVRAASAAALTLALGACATTGATVKRAAPPKLAPPSAIQTGSVLSASIADDGVIDPNFEIASKAERAAADADPKARRARLSGAFLAYIREAAETSIEAGRTYGATVHLATLYENDPRDKAVAYQLARHLRYLGAHADAERIVRDALTAHAGDPLLRLEQAKILIADGRADAALAVLRPLRAERPRDPSVMQAVGVALDRKGAHDRAQAVYAEAMAIGRPNASLLNNAGLSHLMGGDPKAAAKLLRRAASASGATAQVRQNLALALSLSGDKAGARAMAESAAGGAEQAEALLAMFDAIAPTVTAWDIAAGE